MVHKSRILCRPGYHTNLVHRAGVCLISLVTAWIAIPASVTAHPFHACQTEVGWNDASRRFEVAMQIGIADLEDALSVEHQRRIRLEHHADADSLLAAYVRTNFTISSRTAAAGRLQWIGHEFELHSVWLYFEIHADQELRTVSTDNKPTQRRSDSATSVARRGIVGMLPDEPLEWAGAPGRYDDIFPVRVTNRVLFRTLPGHINMVTLTCNNGVASVHCSPDSPCRIISSIVRSGRRSVEKVVAAPLSHERSSNNDH